MPYTQLLDSKFCLSLWSILWNKEEHIISIYALLPSLLFFLHSLLLSYQCSSAPFLQIWQTNEIHTAEAFFYLISQGDGSASWDILLLQFTKRKIPPSSIRSALLSSCSHHLSKAKGDFTLFQMAVVKSYF